MLSTEDINSHPCPKCGHKIGIHVNSPFNNNPRIDNINSIDYGEECNRTYNSLLIEKLTAWWNDAMSERDAYMKSYERACAERDAFFENGVKVAKERDAWQNTATVLFVKLKKAVDALKHYKSSDIHWDVSPKFADDALTEIEGE